MKRPTSGTLAYSVPNMRFEQLTPRQKQRKRQELVDRFKSNVTNFIASTEAAHAQKEMDQTRPYQAAASETVATLLNQTLKNTDTFLQRKKQKRRTLRS